VNPTVGVATAMESQPIEITQFLFSQALSEIVRRRRAVRLKARAATAEIRVSAIVLGSIPFFIIGALLVVSPGYLEPLISDPRGNLIVGAALLSLLLAGVTMRAMLRAALSG